MTRAGAEAPSANRITLLRDADGDGVAETRSAFLEGLNSPFGMALRRRHALRRQRRRHRRFPLHGRRDRDHRARRKDRRPAGRAANHHWTKDVIASQDGTKLYATVGSNSNVGENGMDERGEPRRRARDRPGDAADPPLRLRPAQSERPVLAPRQRRTLGRGQRARRDRQRSRPRLHDLGQGRRLLRLALQLFRPACRRARRAAAPRTGRKGDRARLCARRAHRLARPDLLRRRPVRPGNSPAAPSSASTARGTAARAAATR